MKSPLGIDRKFLPYKAYYFLNCAGMSSLIPYFPVYMKYIGLSASESAWIIGFMPFMCFFVTPIWCMLADKFHKHKLLLVMCTALSPIFLSMSYLVPRIENPLDSVEVYLHANNSLLTISKCQLFGKDTRNSSDTAKCSHSDPGDGYLRFNGVCRLWCNSSASEASNVFGMQPIQLCQQNRSSCEDFGVHRNLPMENLSFAPKETAVKGTDCPQYAIRSFESYGSQYFSLNVKSSLILKCGLSCKPTPVTGNTYFNLASSHSFIFGLVFLLYLFYLVFHVPCFRIIDALTVVALSDEDMTKWGRTRVFGTIGWAAFAYLSGQLMDIVSESPLEPKFYPAFVLFLVFSLLAAFSGLFVQMEEDIHCAELFKNLAVLFKNFEITLFLIIMFIFGMFSGVLGTFLFWYLEELCAPKALMGLATIVACSGEILVLCFSGWVIDKTGHRPVFYITFLSFFIRFLSYTFLVNPWYVLLIEPLNGISFGLLVAAVTEYTGIIAPPGMAATLQGLVGGIHWGLGLGTGSLIAGQIYHAFGGVITFRSFAALSLIVLLIVWPLEHFVVRKGKRGADEKYELAPMDDSDDVGDHEGIIRKQPVMDSKLDYESTD